MRLITMTTETEATAITKADSTTAAIAISSSGENPENIPSLTSAVQELQGSVDRWITGALAFTAITAVCAASYFVCSGFAIARGRKLRDAQSALDKAKDDIIAKTNERTTNAELELQRLKTDRHLTPEQREKLLHNIQIMGVPRTIFIQTSGIDDSDVYASDFEGVFREAHWQVSKQLMGFGISRHNGLNLFVFASGDDKQSSLALARVFIDCGLPATLDDDDRTAQAGEMILQIGRKSLTIDPRPALWQLPMATHLQIGRKSLTIDPVKSIEEMKATINERAADRFIAGEKRKDFIDRLKQDGKQGMRLLYVSSGEPERFARDLRVAFDKAAWTLSGIAPAPPDAKAADVVVTTTDNENDIKVANDICEGLSSCGIEANYSKSKSDILTVIVGTKTPK
jgi:hypothetical protein